jgi:hypothetical protein
MTVDEVVARIRDLREITRKTGCITRRTQSEFLASLPDDLLLAAAPALSEFFTSEEASNG